jgi:putative spermidine/putrescine transport system permease protein
MTVSALSSSIAPKTGKDYGRHRFNWFPILLMSPLLLILLIFFVVPLARSVLISFYHFTGPMAFNSSYLTIENYTHFMDPFYLGILWRTIGLSAIVTVCCVALGYPVAYYMTKLDGRKQQLYMIIYLAPWLVNVVVKALGWIILLSDYGYVNNWLLNIGLIQHPLHFLYNDLGIVIGLTHGEMVFAVLPIFASLASIDPNLPLAAANLGAKGLQSFIKIIFPLTLPGVVAGSVIVFTMSMAAYTTPALLGGAQSRVLSYMVYQQNTAVLNWPFGSAMGLLMVIATIAIVMIYTRAMSSGKLKVIMK